MAASTFYDRVKAGVTAAPGTGALALGSAVPGFQSFTGAGVTDGALVSYVIEDGTSFEVGQGTYSLSAGTLARTTVGASSAGAGVAINASANAVVSITVTSADLAALAASGGSGGSSASAYASATYWRLRFVSTYGSGGVAEIGQITFKDATGAIIPTTGGTPFATSDYASSDYNEACVFNGTGGTANSPYGWAGTSRQDSIGYHFSSAVTPASVQLECGGDGANGQSNAPLNFVIEYSNDGSTYLPVYTGNTAPFTTGVFQNFPLNKVMTSTAAKTYTTYRLNPLTGGSNVFGFAEIKYGDSTGAFPAISGAAASETGNKPAANAVDGDDTTYWFSTDNSNTQTFDVTYATGFAATILYLYPPPPAAGWTPLSVAVYGSNDGATFTKIGTVTFSAWNAGSPQTVPIVAGS